MKKTLFLITGMATISLMAQGATLVSEWNGFTNDRSATTGNLAFSSYGTSSVSDGVLNVSANGSLANRPTIDLSSSSLSLYDGLTISLKIKGMTAGVQDIMLGLASSETQFLFSAGKNSSNQGYFFFNGSANNAGNSPTQVIGVTSADTYSIITVTTAWDDSNVTFKMYENGTQVATGKTNNTTLTQQDLSKMVLGGWAGESDGSTSSEQVSRLAIYDGAMTAEEVQTAYTAWSVPEPTTATLSLLGLAGLMLRRRK